MEDINYQKRNIIDMVGIGYFKRETIIIAFENKYIEISK